MRCHVCHTDMSEHTGSITLSEIRYLNVPMHKCNVCGIKHIEDKVVWMMRRAAKNWKLGKVIQLDFLDILRSPEQEKKP